MVLHAHIEARSHPRGSKYGSGLFATCAIAKGELLWWEDHSAEPQHIVVARSRAWIEALPPGPKAAYKHFVYQTGEDEFESLPEFDLLPQEQWAEAAPADVSMYMNHSCDPTSWFEFEHPGWVDGPGVMTARRDIAQGEEITFDYATSEGAFDQTWTCACGAAECRGRIQGADWKRPELQVRYSGHFMPYLASRIAVLRDQREMEKACIANWGLSAHRNEALGAYLVAERAVPAGVTVLVLPPNRILRHHEVKDFERILTVRYNASDPADTSQALYSESLTASDLDNFMAHSCEPACEAVIDPATLCVTIRARKPIAAGGLVSIDYEATETDMVTQGCAFECACGAARCRKRIVGLWARQRMASSGSGGSAQAVAAAAPPVCGLVPQA